VLAGTSRLKSNNFPQKLITYINKAKVVIVKHAWISGLKLLIPLLKKHTLESSE